MATLPLQSQGSSLDRSEWRAASPAGLLGVKRRTTKSLTITAETMEDDDLPRVVCGGLLPAVIPMRRHHLTASSVTDSMDGALLSGNFNDFGDSTSSRPTLVDDEEARLSSFEDNRSLADIMRQHDLLHTWTVLSGIIMPTTLHNLFFGSCSKQPKRQRSWWQWSIECMQVLWIGALYVDFFFWIAYLSVYPEIASQLLPAAVYFTAYTQYLFLHWTIVLIRRWLCEKKSARLMSYYESALLTLLGPSQSLSFSTPASVSAPTSSFNNRDTSLSSPSPSISLARMPPSPLHVLRTSMHTSTSSSHNYVSLSTNRQTMDTSEVQTPRPSHFTDGSSMALSYESRHRLQRTFYTCLFVVYVVGTTVYFAVNRTLLAILFHVPTSFMLVGVCCYLLLEQQVSYTILVDLQREIIERSLSLSRFNHLYKPLFDAQRKHQHNVINLLLFPALLGTLFLFFFLVTSAVSPAAIDDGAASGAHQDAVVAYMLSIYSLLFLRETLLLLLLLYEMARVNEVSESLQLLLVQDDWVVSKHNAADDNCVANVDDEERRDGRSEDDRHVDISRERHRFSLALLFGKVQLGSRVFFAHPTRFQLLLQIASTVLSICGALLLRVVSTQFVV